jgi:hypothetical protein
MWDGMAGINKAVSTKRKSDIFFARALDSPAAGQPDGQISCVANFRAENARMMKRLKTFAECGVEQD